MSRKSEDYYSVVEQIIKEPESYDGWATTASEQERFEIKEIIRDTVDFGEDFDN